MTELEKAKLQIELYRKKLIEQDITQQSCMFPFQIDGVNFARFLDAIEQLISK